MVEKLIDLCKGPKYFIFFRAYKQKINRQYLMRFCQFSKVFFHNGNQLVWKSVIPTIVTKIVLDGKNACASLGAFVFENETKYFVNNYVVFLP